MVTTAKYTASQKPKTYHRNLTGLTLANMLGTTANSLDIMVDTEGSFRFTRKQTNNKLNAAFNLNHRATVHSPKECGRLE